LRGMRGAADFELELEMSQINNFLSGGIETVFLMTSPEHSFIRSSRVWEILEFGDAIDNLVPKNVAEFLLKNYR
jgi:pantetheine-phosphate adenylyltransferase